MCLAQPTAALGKPVARTQLSTFGAMFVVNTPLVQVAELDYDGGVGDGGSKRLKCKRDRYGSWKQAGRSAVKSHAEARVAEQQSRHQNRNNKRSTER